MKVDLTQSEIGALIFVLGTEIGRLRAVESEDCDEAVLNNEINFYKTLACKLNKTI